MRAAAERLRCDTARLTGASYPGTNRLYELVVGAQKAINAAAEEAALSKRLLFLSRSQKVFHLWHVIHKPFSYAFAVLALLHIGLQFVLGYF